MDLSLSDEQKQLQERPSASCATSTPSRTGARSPRPTSGLLPENWAQFAELGWLGMSFSEEDGGYGGGPIETMIVMEQFGKGLVLEPFLPTVVLGGGMIAAAGSAAQKEALLAPMIEGKKQFAFAWLERQSRYNLADVSLKAEKEGARLDALGPQGRGLQRGLRRQHHRARPHRRRRARGEGAHAVRRRRQGQGRDAPRLPDPGRAARLGAHLRQGLGRRRCGAGQGRRRVPGGRGRGRPRDRGAVRRGRPAAWTRSTRRRSNTSRPASSSACRSASSRCCSIAWSTASPTPRKRAR